MYYEKPEKASVNANGDMHLTVPFSDLSTLQLRKSFEEWMKEAYVVMNYVILFLELHMPRIVLIAAALLCVYDKCGLFFFIALLVVVAFTIGKKVIPTAIYISSIFVSIVLLARMVYQIEYIEHDMWNVTCDVSAPCRPATRLILFSFLL